MKQLLLKLAPAFLLVPLFFIIVPMVRPGVILGGGDFPFFISPDYVSTKLFLWTENGSFPAFDRLSRAPLVGISYLLSNIGFSSELFSKVQIIGGFLAASISFYAAFTLLFRNRLGPGYSQFTFKFAAICGSIFYAYNIWSFQRIGHWYFWIGYALMPIFAASLIMSLETRKWKYVLLAVALWSIASMTSHMVIFYGLIMAAVCLFFLGRSLYRRSNVVFTIKPIASILVLFILINFYWIYPYLLSRESPSTSPSYLISHQVLDLLSRDSITLNLLRLNQNWAYSADSEPARDSPLFPAWQVSAFAIPIVAFSSILIRRDIKHVLIFASVGIVGFLLASGTKGPSGFYSSLIFNFLANIPLISNFVWLFRDPDKWAFLIALSYAFLLSSSIFQISRAIRNVRYGHVMSCLMISLILIANLIYIYPMYNDRFQGGYSPVVIPDDFEKLNDRLSSIESDRVIFMPKFGGASDWSEGKAVKNIYETSSIKPNIDLSNNPAYYGYLVDSLTSDRIESIDNFIYPLGTSHIVFHNDRQTNQVQRMLNGLESSNDVEDLGEVGFFKLFQMQKSTGQMNIPNQNIAVVGGYDKLRALNAIDSFNTVDSSILFIDQTTYPDKYDILLESDILVLRDTDDLALSMINEEYLIEPFDATTNYQRSQFWSMASVSDPVHGDFHPYLQQIGLRNWEFDYGKGLVMTSGKDILNINFEISNSEDYDIYVRYLENQKGGNFRVSLDGEEIASIDSVAQSNTFHWHNLGKFQLKAGPHTLTLENLSGFNAVNLFAAIPITEMQQIFKKATLLTENARNMFVLEPESDFHAVNTNGVSRIIADLEIHKASTYTLALKAMCDQCSELQVLIDDQPYFLELRNDHHAMEWYYLTIDLEMGKHLIDIVHDNQYVIDSVILYSDAYVGETIDEIFATSQPAQILDYTKIDPTKYTVSIKSDRPYILSLAETYDPLWIASATDLEVRSIPLYSIVNGFYIDKVGEYTLTIEYLPQSWTLVGVSVSIITLVMLIPATVVLSYYGIIDKTLSRMMAVISLVGNKIGRARVKQMGRQYENAADNITNDVAIDSSSSSKGYNSMPKIRDQPATKSQLETSDALAKDVGSRKQLRGSLVKKVVSKIRFSDYPIIIAILLIASALVLLLQSDEKTANTVLTSAIYILAAGVIWKIVVSIASNKKRTNT